ncbi:hypothetical protein CTI14_10445, partial [Methylobacterium radiotolerans]
SPSPRRRSRFRIRPGTRSAPPKTSRPSSTDTARRGIDWDGASPSTRSWDLAFSAQTFALPDPTRDPQRSAEDLAAFVDGYGADEALRAVLADMMRRRTQAMLDLLRSSAEVGREPWGTMYRTGSRGRTGAAVLDYVTAHRGVWQRALG